MTCRHCGKGKVCRPRGLCWRCYYTPGVRDLYPSTSKFNPHKDKHDRGGETLEELEALIESRRPTMPPR